VNSLQGNTGCPEIAGRRSLPPPNPGVLHAFFLPSDHCARHPAGGLSGRRRGRPRRRGPPAHRRHRDRACPGGPRAVRRGAHPHQHRRPGPGVPHAGLGQGRAHAADEVRSARRQPGVLLRLADQPGPGRGRLRAPGRHPGLCRHRPPRLRRHAAVRRKRRRPPKERRRRVALALGGAAARRGLWQRRAEGGGHPARRPAAPAQNLARPAAADRQPRLEPGVHARQRERARAVRQRVGAAGPEVRRRDRGPAGERQRARAAARRCSRWPRATCRCREHSTAELETPPPRFARPPQGGGTGRPAKPARRCPGRMGATHAAAERGGTTASAACASAPAW
jgi:hypothetical protein